MSKEGRAEVWGHPPPAPRVVSAWLSLVGPRPSALSCDSTTRGRRPSARPF